MWCNLGEHMVKELGYAASKSMEEVLPHYSLFEEVRGETRKYAHSKQPGGG